MRKALMRAKHAKDLLSLLQDGSFEGEFFVNEPMSRHTTYQIGGPARYLVRADTLSSLRRLIDASISLDIEWMVLGKGSNVLFSDEGYDGVIIVLGSDFKKIAIDRTAGIISCGAACLFSRVIQEAFICSLGGLEFGAGTPGTIGGAIYGNAGTGSDWIGHVVKDVTVFSPKDERKLYKNTDIEWGYRTTSIRSDEVILECRLALAPKDDLLIRAKMDANLKNRRKSQPLNLPCCGSVFKNPEGMSAGKLIDDLHLKGERIGGAMVSDVHANFIVNTGGASASDVCRLIDLLRQRVYEAYGVRLVCEVNFCGFEQSQT